MLKLITILLSLSALTGILASCGSTPTVEEKPAEPLKIKAPSVPLPVDQANPLDAFRKLTNDTQLPTDAQLADGAESSVGGSNPIGQPDNHPSTSIKPPPSEPEDLLVPNE